MISLSINATGWNLNVAFYWLDFVWFHRWRAHLYIMMSQSVFSLSFSLFLIGQYIFMYLNSVQIRNKMIYSIPDHSNLKRIPIIYWGDRFRQASMDVSNQKNNVISLHIEFKSNDLIASGKWYHFTDKMVKSSFNALLFHIFFRTWDVFAASFVYFSIFFCLFILLRSIFEMK